METSQFSSSKVFNLNRGDRPVLQLKGILSVRGDRPNLQFLCCVFFSSGKQITERKIGFIGINPKDYKPQLTDYQGFPPYFYFDSPGVDGVLSGFSGPEAESNYRSDLTTQQYFSLTDLKTAEKILQTVKQNIN